MIRRRRAVAAALKSRAAGHRSQHTWLLVFCLASLGLHLALRLVFPALPRSGGGSLLSPPAAPSVAEVALEPPPVLPVPRPAPTTSPAAIRPAGQKGSGAIGPRFAGRKTGHGSGAGESASARPGPPSPANLVPLVRRATPGALRLRRPSPKAAFTRPGGGSAAPAKVLGGRNGARGPVAAPDDLLFSGGGRGGVNLPRAVARLGGGGGSVLPGVTTNKATQTVREPKPGTGPGTGGAAGTGAGGGTGFVNGAGIGARPDVQSRHDRATLKSASDGSGVGAARDPANSTATGTRAPGGGTETGSPLPGTGGTGAGYGRGTGNDAGGGSGDSSAPAGGGGGANGGGPGGSGGRGRVFDVPAPAGRDANGRLHAVYVLDCSWSMEEQNKIRKAKGALKKALSELQPGDTFNVIAFSGTFTSFAPVPQPATPANLRAAARFVDLARMGEGTNLGDALKAAFASDPVTQVWVLSDGIPNVGVTDPNELRALVRERGRGRAQVITLALGLGENFPGVELLKALAADNNGTFQMVDLRDARRRR